MYLTARVLKEAYLPKTVGIWYFDGRFESVATGNLFRHKDKYFVLTCRHVIDAIEGSAKASLKMFDGTHLTLSDFERFNRTDKARDQAALRITADIHPEHYYEASDFQQIPDYSAHDFSTTALYLTGFPADLIEADGQRRELVPYSYMTVLYEGKSRTEDAMYLDYPVRTDGIEMANREVEVPRPGGMSGSLLFALPRWDDPKLWHAGLVKVIGMQCRAVEDLYLVCTNTKHCLSFFQAEF
jgi:hypothetical protein